jgi:hypothetical protein
MAELPIPKEEETVLYRAGKQVPAEKKEQAQANRLPIFIHPKALTFPIFVALVKGAWAAVSVLPLEWGKTVWFPFVLCMLLGLLVVVSNLTEHKVGALDWITGMAIGFLNSLVVFGAVVGIRGQ